MFFFGDLDVLSHKNLKPVDKLVYFCLASYFNRKTLTCYPRVSTLAERLNLQKITVYRAIARLKKAGLISIIRKQSTNEYKMPNLARLISAYNSDLSQRISINKTNILKPYTNYKKNYLNKYNFQNSTPLPILNKDITHKGVSLKYKGSEGLLDEYRDKDGVEWTKNRVTGEVKKKLKILGYVRFNTKAYKNL